MNGTIEKVDLFDFCGEACTQAVLDLRLNNIHKLERTQYAHRIQRLQELLRECNSEERAIVITMINNTCATYQLRAEKKDRLLTDLELLDS